MISLYNADRPVPSPANLANLIMYRAEMEVFLCTDYEPSREAFTALIGWSMRGKLEVWLGCSAGFREHAADVAEAV